MPSTRRRNIVKLIKTKDSMVVDIDQMSPEAMRAMLKAALDNQSRAIEGITYEQLVEHMNGLNKKGK